MKKRWIRERISGPVSIELKLQVPEQIADGTAAPGVYECQVVDVVLVSDDTETEPACMRKLNET